MWKILGDQWDFASERNKRICSRKFLLFGQIALYASVMPTEEMSRVGANLGKVFIHEHVMAET
jgi:hypothetical protein